MELFFFFSSLSLSPLILTKAFTHSNLFPQPPPHKACPALTTRPSHAPFRQGFATSETPCHSPSSQDLPPSVPLRPWRKESAREMLAAFSAHWKYRVQTTKQPRFRRGGKRFQSELRWMDGVSLQLHGDEANEKEDAPLSIIIGFSVLFFLSF